MNKHTMTALFSLLITLSCAEAIWASGAGTGIFGDPVPAMKDIAGVRHFVELRADGGLLVGRPSQGSLSLIAIRAPNLTGSSLIIREKRDQDGSVLLQLVAPAELGKQLHGATLFFKGRELRLAQAKEGRWTEVSAQKVADSLLPASQLAGNRVTAFAAGDLGVFKLVHEQAPVGATQGHFVSFDDFATNLRWNRAVWHFIWPIVLLGAAALSSKLAHALWSTRGL